MNVLIHFIYGGTLDFPDKANVGYVWFFNDFKYKSINILWLLLCWALFKSVNGVEASILLSILPILCVFWEYLKIVSHLI